MVWVASFLPQYYPGFFMTGALYREGMFTDIGTERLVVLSVPSEVESYRKLCVC